MHDSIMHIVCCFVWLYFETIFPKKFVSSLFLRNAFVKHFWVAFVYKMCYTNKLPLLCLACVKLASQTSDCNCTVDLSSDFLNFRYCFQTSPGCPSDKTRTVKPICKFPVTAKHVLFCVGVCAPRVGPPGREGRS